MTNQIEKQCYLSLKQRIFVQEYLVDLNATKAAIRAGYAVTSARQIGSENLSKPYIQDAIAEAMQERAERVRFTSDDVLQRLVDIDHMDIIDIFTDCGLVKPVSEWPPVWRQSISAVDVLEVKLNGSVTGIIKRILLPDKLRNLEMLGRHSDVNSWNNYGKGF